MSLPRYETTEDYYQAGISALAPYLDIETLRAMVQANRRFFHIFSSYLWEDPVKYLRLSDTHRPFERIVALFLHPPFQKNNVFVKSLDLRPILHEAFQRQHERDYWNNEPDLNLETILRFITKMPNLRYLILDGMPSAGDGTYRETNPGSGLDMLVFSVVGCFTVDVSLVLRQPRFHHLMYLDMSGSDTTQSSFWQLEHLDLQNLRVLKMRQLRLTTIPKFVLRCGPLLWSLDVRDNLLEDPQIRRLLDSCRQPAFPGVAEPVRPDDDAAMYESPPVYQKHDHGPLSTLSTRRPDSASAVIRHMEEHAQSENGSMYTQSGLTNLYVSGNRLTSEILVDLLSTRNRLQVLDIGTVRTANKNKNKNKNKTKTKTKNHTTDLSPAAPPHTSVWWSPPSPTPPSAQPSPIQELRIHHSWATYTPTISITSTDTFHLPHLHDAELFGRAYTSAAATDPLAAATHHHLTSLTLTGIPTKSHGFTMEQLTRLLRDAARARSAQQAQQASSAETLLSALRLLRLEFVRPDTRQEEEEDEKGERGTFLASTRGDSSFFPPHHEDDDDDDDDEGKGENVGASTAQTNMQAKAKAKAKAKANLPPPAGDDLRDVVAELKAFRASGEVPRWDGTLQLVVPLGGFIAES